jgi:hypothetical protein
MIHLYNFKIILLKKPSETDPKALQTLMISYHFPFTVFAECSIF